MQKPVSVLHIHGTADTHNPYDGGLAKGGAAKIVKNSTMDSIKTILKADKCDTKAETSEREDLVFYRYQCPNRTKVELIKIVGGGHAWPGGVPPKNKRFAEATTRNLKTNDVIWSFFSEVGR